MTLQLQDRRGATSLHNRGRADITVLRRDQKPHPLGVS